MTEPANGGESRSGGEFLEQAIIDVGQRIQLTRELREAGHPQCADDLAEADETTVAQVAHDIAEHVEYACGCPHGQHVELGVVLRGWADRHEALYTENRGITIIEGRGLHVELRRDGDHLFVDLKSDDVLDLASDGDMQVTITVEGEGLFTFHKMGPSTEVTGNGHEPPAQPG